MQSYRNLKPENNLCDGTRHGHDTPCNGQLYKCTGCGTVGCRQMRPERCSNQNFSSLFACQKCGAIGKQEMIPDTSAA